MAEQRLEIVWHISPHYSRDISLVEWDFLRQIFMSRWTLAEKYVKIYFRHLTCELSLVQPLAIKSWITHCVLLTNIVANCLAKYVIWSLCIRVYQLVRFISCNIGTTEGCISWILDSLKYVMLDHGSYATVLSYIWRSAARVSWLNHFATSWLRHQCHGVHVPLTHRKHHP